MKFKKRLHTVEMGFGVIELFVVLLAISIIAISLTKTLRKNLTSGETGVVYTALKDIFDKEFQSSESVKVDEAGQNYFIYRSNSGAGGFRFSGFKPFGKIEKLDNGKWVAIADNVYELRFTFYDDRGSLIIDEEASRKPELIKRIKITAKIHNGKEESGYYLADGAQGVDLDGDKTNGVARLKTIDFIEDLK